MALGQAAGTAAHLAIASNSELRRLDTSRLQRLLLGQGAVLTFFKDIDRNHSAYAALQYFGTKGFFPDYWARADHPLERATAARWLNVRIEGEGVLSRTEAAELLQKAGKTAPWAPSAQPVLRGEFCAALYR